MTIELEKRNIPLHIAFIMDGNGRWAKERKQPRTFGHKQGVKNIRDLAIECNNLGVKAMTVYAFSTENWSRPSSEVQYIFKLPKVFFSLYMKELVDNNIQIRMIGHMHALPKATQRVILDAIEETKYNTGLILCFAVNYGGQDEIVTATKSIVQDVLAGKCSVDDINQQLFQHHLMTASMPPLEFVIRTSGEVRLSNFLLWQSAYAELYFTDVKWPDFNVVALHNALDVFNTRQRRHGGIADED